MIRTPEAPALTDMMPLDPEYTMLIDRVNSRFDPLTGIRMPSPDDHRLPLHIFDEVHLEHYGVPAPVPEIAQAQPAPYIAPQPPEWPPRPAATPAVRPLWQRDSDLPVRAVVPVPGPTAEHTRAQAVLHNQTGAQVTPELLQRVLTGLRNLDGPAAAASQPMPPRPRQPERPAAPLQQVDRSKAIRSNCTTVPVIKGKEEQPDPDDHLLDEKFADFWRAEDDRHRPERRSHRRESRLKRISTRIGATVMGAAAAFPLVDAAINYLMQR